MATRLFRGRFWYRYKRNKSAVLALFTVFLLFIIAIFAPDITLHDPRRFSLKSEDIYLSPNLDNPMGTDEFGRDIFSRVIMGIRVSMVVGLIAAFISTSLGTLIGAFSGYMGGVLDNFLMRFVEFLLSLPIFFLALLITAIYGSNFWNVVLVIGLTAWPGTARLVRSAFLLIKEKEFVVSAKAIGVSDIHIIFNEILPNAFYPAIINGSLQVGSAVIMEAGLSFLGLGDPNIISLGYMLNKSISTFRSAWWTAFFPGLAITLVVLSLNLVSQGLNDALNPQLKGN